MSGPRTFEQTESTIAGGTAISGASVHVSGRAMPEAAREYFSVAEFAQRTGLSETTVRRYLKKGLLPRYQPGGRRSRVLIPAAALTETREKESAPTGSNSPPPTKEIAVTKNNPGPTPRWRTHAQRR